MSAAAKEVYGDALVRPGGGLHARYDDGSTQALPLARWLGPATPEECAALDRLGGPVLDVGCGAGRHVIELQRRGVGALGIDVVPHAVEVARRRSAAVLQRSVFAPLPGEGRWASALLLDGNVGIGGDPAALLARLGQLLRPGGQVLAELDPPHVPGGSFRIRVEGAAGPSRWFAWARLGPLELERVAASAGFAVSARWRAAGRHFCSLGAP